MNEEITWHYHHLVPLHEGGSNAKSNLLKCNIAMHAFLHLLRYQETKKWQDKLAYEGLLGLKKDCKTEAIRQGALLGSAKANGGFMYTDGKQAGKYMPGTEPDGWRKLNKGEYYKLYVRKEKDLTKDGRSTRTKRHWFNNGSEEGQFELNTFPEGWNKGRLKSSTERGRIAALEKKKNLFDGPDKLVSTDVEKQ